MNLFQTELNNDEEKNKECEDKEYETNVQEAIKMIILKAMTREDKVG